MHLKCENEAGVQLGTTSKQLSLATATQDLNVLDGIAKQYNN